VRIVEALPHLVRRQRPVVHPHAADDAGGDRHQCFPMPASGWSAIGTLGYKYRDTRLSSGPVKNAQIKKLQDRART